MIRRAPRCTTCHLQEVAHEPNDHPFKAARRKADPSILWIPGSFVALALVLFSFDLFMLGGVFGLCVWLMVVTDQRDQTAVSWADEAFRANGAEHEARRLAEDLDAALTRLAEVLDEHALCPTPVRPVEVSRGLRSVPAQRDGSEYEWPAIVRAVEGEVEA